jgi:hypothetical protein
MTQVKAQAVSSAVVGAGYQARAFQRLDGEWIVQARSPLGYTVNAAAITALANAQAVLGLVAEVEFS